MNQLVALLRAIRMTDRGEQYRIIDRNCFWLVRMARLAIMHLAQNALARGQVLITTTEEAERRLGKCGCVRLDGSTSSHDMDDVEQVISRYERYCEDFLRSYHVASHIQLFQGYTSLTLFQVPNTVTSIFSSFVSVLSGLSILRDI